MKWQTGKGLYAIRGVSQREPRSASCAVDVDLARLGAEEGVVEAELALDDRRRPCRAVRGEPRGEDARRAPPRPGGSASSRVPSSR